MKRGLKTMSLGAVILLAVLGGSVGSHWGWAQSVYPIRWDRPEIESATTGGDVEQVDPKIFEVEATAGSLAQVTISRNAIDALCGDGNGCGFRLILLGGGTPGIETATFAISDSDYWTIDRDGSGSGGRLSDFDDKIILEVDVSVPLASFQGCSFGELTVDGGSFSFQGFELIAENDGFPNRCVLRVDD